MKHNDFFEGVRSVLIDRDQSPNYKYRNVSDVTDEAVDRFSNPLNLSGFKAGADH
ncbi:enoyl-CoA hydratase/isomerase family protein [Bacillus licheniformis]|nr:enoyl-CoA hydratase/isomerase family protein [Bacillus licheniformis]